MSSQSIIDKALVLMDQHLEQLRIHSTTITKDGLKGLTQYDSQVIERYTKLALALSKPSDAGSDDLAGKTEEELRKILEGDNEDVPTETSDGE